MTNSPASAESRPADTITAPARVFGWNLLRYAVEWIDDRRYMARHRRYLDELERSGELDGLLEAMALTREQLAAFAISPLASAELLNAVMVRIGLADIYVGRIATSSTDLAVVCRSCGNWRRCRRWLQSVADEDAYRGFCPNAERLDHLREDNATVEAVRSSGDRELDQGQAALRSDHEFPATRSRD